MPYLKQARKNEFRDSLNALTNDLAAVDPNPGDLNYLFTSIALLYMKQKGVSYQHINDVLGSLDGAGKEFYRRYAGPYEDSKIVSNGDVYPEPE